MKPPQKIKPPMSEFFVSRSTSSKMQELKIGKDIGGVRTPASGAFVGHKGDVEGKRFLIEAKQTEKNSYALSRKTIIKIDKEALGYGKIPAIVIEFLGMRADVERMWAVVPYSVFMKIAAKENEV
jgi:hypothetical protein